MPNSDGTVTVANVFYLINFLFADGLPPIGVADANADGAIRVGDIFFLIIITICSQGGRRRRRCSDASLLSRL